jgi:integrase/recombinase XerD
MFEDILVTSIFRRDWLVYGPLRTVALPYVNHLRALRYAESTIRTYLKAVAHLAYWMKAKGFAITKIDEAFVNQFLKSHLSSCTCPPPCLCHFTDVQAALKQLLVVMRLEGLAVAAVERPTSITAELEQFRHYLLNTCGAALSTCGARLKHIQIFLIRSFGNTGIVDISLLMPGNIESFLIDFAKRWKPESLKALRTNLRSYFRFRALRGDQTQALMAAMPVIANWKKALPPKGLTNTQLDMFLQAFDLSQPTEQRDYAIARCLVDLGLRGHEVAQLSLDSLNWRASTVTIGSTKGRCTQQLPLPCQTGKAIAQYLRQGRPKTSNRALFVRHVAPLDKPLKVAGIRSSMTRAFIRCGLGNQFCGTHVLRHTTAIRLQQSGASLKEIADVLRHKSLETTTIYAKVDLKALQAVALCWPGRQS